MMSTHDAPWIFPYVTAAEHGRGRTRRRESPSHRTPQTTASPAASPQPSPSRSPTGGGERYMLVIKDGFCVSRCGQFMSVSIV